MRNYNAVVLRAERTEWLLSVRLALIAGVCAYPLFFVWYVFALYAAVFPRFGPPDPSVSPWELVLVPAGLAAAAALTAFTWRLARVDGARLLASLRRFAGLAAASVILAGAVYAAANLRSWDRADAVVSVTLIGCLAIAVAAAGSRTRSVPVVASYALCALLIWPPAMIVARWLAIGFSLLWLVTIGRFFLD